MDADQLNQLGHNASLSGNINQAVEYFKAAIEANPMLPQSYYNLAVCYMARSQFSKALEFYQKALKLVPKNSIILNNIGVTYDYMGNSKHAQTYFRKALKHDPTNILSLSNIGGYLINKNPKKAKKYLEKAYKMNPKIADVCFNLGVCSRLLGEDGKSIKYFKRSLKFNPTNIVALGHLHHQYRQTANFEKANEVKKAINSLSEERIKVGLTPALSAWESVIYNDDNKLNFKHLVAWVNDIKNKVGQQLNRFSFKNRKSSKKLKIGYLSGNFANHPISQQLIGALMNHDKKNFKIFTYSYGKKDKSIYQKEIKKITNFTDVANLDSTQIAEKIYGDKIDILVDLAGPAQKSKFEILAQKPAPLQISWLGFPGTTGADFIDYLITDKTVTTQKDIPFYLESLIYLPHTFQSTDNQLSISKNKKRVDFKLPASQGGSGNRFLFCCFNEPYQIDQSTFNSWMNILKKTPDSYLCLQKKSTTQVRNLKKEARKACVDSKRIILLPKLPKPDHLARISLCDLALDTFTSNGQLTSDVLWSGVPVIALEGKHFASRTSASLLKAINLNELITKTEKEYEGLATTLAGSVSRLTKIKDKLRANKPTYPLFDTKRFTKNLEKAYRKAWKNYQKGFDPKTIYIKDKIDKKTLSMAENNIAVILHEKEKYPQAIKHFKKAISLNPKNALAFNNLATTYNSIGNSIQAIKNWEKSAEVDPKSPEPLGNLGIFYQDRLELEKARQYFNKVIKLDTKNSTMYSNIGVSYLYQSNYQPALKYLKKAVEINNQDFVAFYNLALVYNQMGIIKKAIESVKKSLDIAPDFGHNASVYARLLMEICDWKNFKKACRALTPETEAAFLNINRTQDQNSNLKVAKHMSHLIEDKARSYSKMFTFPKKREHKRLKIGYLTRDYFTHATSYLILRLFEYHNRDKFEIYAYSYGPDDNSKYRRKLERDADHFIDIANTGHLKAAEIINNDQIDILVDLKGHTRDHRLEILALRPAPVQATWLGYPGTTGANFVDYIITDKIVTPKAYSKYYTEKFAYVPDCYQINDNQRVIADTTYKRSDFRLPAKSFVFSCFNNNSKINEKTFTSWMRILKRVKGSVLWIMQTNKLSVKNLKKAAKARRIDPKRIIPTKHLYVDEHLARIKLVDLGLDTFTYNGHTTTSDCLWAGVPVITLQGDHFASRVASSILTAAGLPELITKTPKEFENLAVAIATDRKLLKELKLRTKKARKTSSLFNTKLFVKNLEKTYTAMWKIHQSGDKPKL